MKGKGWIDCGTDVKRATSWLKWGYGCMVNICGHYYVRPRYRCRIKAGGKTYYR